MIRCTRNNSRCDKAEIQPTAALSCPDYLSPLNLHESETPFSGCLGTCLTDLFSLFLSSYAVFRKTFVDCCWSGGLPPVEQCQSTGGKTRTPLATFMTCKILNIENQIACFLSVLCKCCMLFLQFDTVGCF